MREFSLFWEVLKIRIEDFELLPVSSSLQFRLLVLNTPERRDQMGSGIILRQINASLEISSGKKME